mmetsp:Transcript_109395/g.172439  ORF Transcript_109395/g.172439 Transcript_109395/m.172439 type:complete len:203 (+) Transcript_109395:56-664(+)|eukprot:CAMPEP_0169124394 /NCGR_PEP_ID=MMETSP1015-20121227/34301_1 /TAXON_ID=342587 /ORGANISM="Karlodinium micrum, Strain CCMP2283" /LENGTH=202 /DNA_ID=CAMNT_0009187807 /DNA_START=53 /DNA_END=661 /DNA_ORIENTATION=-
MQSVLTTSAKSDEAANLEVVRKAGAAALSLELPFHMEAMGAGERENDVFKGTCLTPLPSPVSEPDVSPSASLSSPGFHVSGSFSRWGTASLSPMPRTEKVSFGSIQALSPSTPGTTIRTNAASFGIPLSLQPMVGEIVVPVPVRTPSGRVVAPSPMNRLNSVAPPATFSMPSTTGTVQMMNGSYPFVTPFSAGLRGARGGGA